MKTYTKIENDIIQCNDCGAFAETEEQVKHFDTCKDGECERQIQRGKDEEKLELEKNYICQCKQNGEMLTEKLKLNDDNPEKNYKNLIEEFNKEEIRRYGKDTPLREFVSIKKK